MDIKIYMSPSCSWSKKTTDWLQKKKISFQELDVMESDRYRDELLEKTNQMSTPVVDVNGQIIIGFKETQLLSIIQNSEKMK